MKDLTIQQIARKRIEILFSQAQKMENIKPGLAKQYVQSAKRIAMAAKIRLPIEFRRRTCKKCNTLFVYGVNCRVRIRQKREPHVVITCLNCGNKKRICMKKRREQVEQNNY